MIFNLITRIGVHRPTFAPRMPILVIKLNVRTKSDTTLYPSVDWYKYLLNTEDHFVCWQLWLWYCLSYLMLGWINNRGVMKPILRSCSFIIHQMSSSIDPLLRNLAGVRYNDQISSIGIVSSSCTSHGLHTSHWVYNKPFHQFTYGHFYFVRWHYKI